MTTPVPRLYVPNGHQLTLNLVQAGQEAAIVLGGVTSPSAFLVKSDYEQWRDAAWSAFRNLIVGDVTCTGATGRAVHEPAGTVTEIGAPVSPAGAKAGATPLASACTLIKWSTATGGRSGKGRTYLPGLPSSEVSAGGRTYASTHSTATATAITGYLGHAAFAGALKPAVLSFRKGAAYQITGGAISPIIGVQRRRMR